MVARLGLMGLGPGPAQESPPPERFRVDMRDVRGVGSRGEGGREKDDEDEGLMSRGRGSSSEDENNHWFGNYIMATHGKKAIQILMWQFHKNKLPRGVQRMKHSAKLNSWSQVFVSLPWHTFSSSSAHNTPIIYSVSKQQNDLDFFEDLDFLVIS